MIPDSLQASDAMADLLVRGAAGGVLPGLLLAAATALALRALPRAGAAFRFAVWSGALLAIAALPVAFAIATGETAARAPLPSAGPTVVRPATPPIAGATALDGHVANRPAPAEPAPPTSAPVLRLPRGLPTLLAGLLLVATAGLLARIGHGYLHLRHLKCTARPHRDLEPALQRCRREVAAPPVRLLISSRVSTPLLAGLDRPAILLPEGLVEKLSAAELDCILLHELAHLRRRDDWTQLGQSLLEALLVFQPATHWIGRILRRERELCCDAWVASLADRHTYARCLTKIARHGLPARGSALAPGALFAPAGLRERIEMLVGKSWSPHPRTSRTAVALAVLVWSAGVSLAWATPWPTVVAADSGPDPSPASSRPAADAEDEAVLSRLLTALDAAAGPEERNRVLVALSPMVLERSALRERFFQELATAPDDSSLRARLSGVLHRSWLSWPLRLRLVEIARTGLHDEVALADFLVGESAYLTGEPQLAERVAEVAAALTDPEARRRAAPLLAAPAEADRRSGDGWTWDEERGWSRAASVPAPEGAAEPLEVAGDVEELTAALDHPDAGARAAAAYRLSTFGRDAAGAASALVRLLDDETPVRRHAGRTSQRWGGSFEREALTSPAEEAAKALVHVGPPALPALEAALGDGRQASETARWALRLVRQSD